MATLPAKKRARPVKAAATATATLGSDDDAFFRRDRPGVVFESKHLAEPATAASLRSPKSTPATLPLPLASEQPPCPPPPPSIHAVINIDTDSEEASGSSAVEVVSSSDDEFASAKQQPRFKKKNPKLNLPDWTRKRRPSDHHTSKRQSIVVQDDGDLIEITSPHTFPHQRRQSKGGRRRSKSITPPPKIDASIVARELQGVRQALGFSNEIPRSMMNAYQQIHQISETIQTFSRTTTSTTSTQQPSQSESSSSKKITFQVSFKFDPRKSNASARAKTHYETPFQVTIGQDESLKKVFEEASTKKMISLDQVVLTFKDRRVFNGSTPSILRIFSSTESLSAYTLEVWNHIETMKQTRPSNPPPPPALQTDDDTRVDHQSSEDDESHDLLTFHVRSNLLEKPIQLSLKPTTLTRSIIKPYIRELLFELHSIQRKPINGLTIQDLDSLTSTLSTALAQQIEAWSLKCKILVDGESLNLLLCIADQGDISDGDMLDIQLAPEMSNLI